ncbi:hypothetical protein [Pseudomonas sp. CFBP 8772]|uniref:hypothetical protein n=1 Tax=unclassified Pseudomonas TaxID=196821 RepID=UPI00177BBCE0|nr:hypothetical protein [Pseudomonas sp. CFBP 8772]MBD8597058.1 hypothetical protein [Pseudomonas sp. CFBP 8772]
MLDRGVLEKLEQDARNNDCPDLKLTQLEYLLLQRYRLMSETDQAHLQRLAEMLARTK